MTLSIFYSLCLRRRNINNHHHHHFSGNKMIICAAPDFFFLRFIRFRKTHLSFFVGREVQIAAPTSHQLSPNLIQIYWWSSQGLFFFINHRVLLKTCATTSSEVGRACCWKNWLGVKLVLGGNGCWHVGYLQIDDVEQLLRNAVVLHKINCCEVAAYGGNVELIRR